MLQSLYPCKPLGEPQNLLDATHRAAAAGHVLGVIVNVES